MNVGRHLPPLTATISKNSTHYIRLLKTAQRYTGTAELQAYLATPNESDKEEEHEEKEQYEEEEDHEDENEEELQIKQGSQSEDVMGEKQEAEDGEYSENEEEETSEEEDSEDSKYEDSGNENQTAEKFFTATKYKNNRHQWLVGFYHYLFEPSAGHKKKYITPTCRPDEKHPGVYQQEWQ